MFENPRDDAIDPQRKITGQIRNRFTFTQPTLRGAQKNWPTAQLTDCHFKGDTCSQRWLLKNQRKVLARQRKVASSGTMCAGEKHQVGKLMGRQLADGQEVCILMHNTA